MKRHYEYAETNPQGEDTHVQIVNLCMKAKGEEDYGKQCETKAFALANLPRTPAYPSGRFGYLARLRS